MKLFLVVIALSLLPGCVRRRLTVRTKPAGADVYVDSKYLGKSPISSSTLYYGTRQVEVVRDGFRTEKILRKFTPPWYQFPPLDFVTETLWPWELRDERVVDVTMVPQQPITGDALNANANQLRLQAAQQTVTVPPGATGGYVPPGGSIEAPSSNVAPGFQPSPPPVNTQTPPPASISPNLGGLLVPGNRIPEVGILQGGGYRPEITAPQN